MEIGKSQIARLVLGYLKSEDCTNAFNEFLTTSKYLERHAPFVKNGKYFSTRVGGLTLVDIITEYSEISCLVEGKLEQTNYYEEHHKMSLVNQLMYIFDNYCQPQPLTPILAKGLNATPSESLPGNSSWKNTSKDSSQHGTSIVEEGSLGDHGNISQISQALLEKSELHEKLADAINSVCKSSQGTDIIGENTFAELDNKIKTIVQKAEQDPIFDQILDEIIGTNVVPTVDVNSPSNVNCNTSRSSSIMRNQTDESPQSVKSGAIGDTSLKTVKTSTPKADSEVIVYNGNLDSYVGNAGALLQPQQHSQIYLAPTGVNPAGLLMVPSMITAPNYFIVNNQTNPTGIMSDNDIMKMPTIILSDPPMKGHKESEKPPQKTIAPKCDNITVSTQCGDYLAVYKDDGEVIVENSKLEPRDEPSPKKKKSVKSRQGLGLRKKLPRQVKMKTDIGLEGEKNKTPSTRTNITKTTPKSGSHVRTLNFTTPPKDGEQNMTTNDDCSKKNASKSLFKDDKKGSGLKDVKAKKASWDADLRELLIPHRVQPVSPDTSTDNLNLTCDDDAELENNAKLIEEAFQSPAKTNTENNVLVENNIEDNAKEEEEVKITEKERIENSLKLGDEKNHDGKPTVEKITVEETELYLRNCNGPQRFKKKCNITSNIVQKCDVDVVIETEHEVTYLENETVKELPKSQDNEIPPRKSRDLVLETPIKSLPKTPGKCELTPFSKALEEHFQGMDLLAMPTPNLPITPSYPITPSIALNTPLHVNRPTDYSTSSSYYQPSDTEQNKSLELMIEECKKLEKREIQQYHMANQGENPDSVQTGTPINNVNEIKRIFNENAVGKKNLSLMTARSSSSSDSEPSNSSSNSSSSSSDSDSEYDPREELRSVIKKETYCLRNRISIPKIDTRRANRSSSSAKTPAKLVTKDNADRKHEQSISKIRIKSTPTSQVRESKTIKKSTARRSCTLSEKHSVKTNEQISKILEAENEITDDDITLHLSTDEESVNRPSTETIKNKEVVSEKGLEKESLSDCEAEQLVQGLRERGIHLLHKKSPKKPSDVVHDESQKEENLKIENNQVILNNDELESEKTEVEILSSKDANSSLNIVNNDSDLSFDIKCFEDEHLKIDFNYNKRKPRKKINNTKVLEKKMKATVYIETLDTEVERVIECTPFEAVFEFIPKNTSKKNKKSEKTTCPNKLSPVSSISNEGKNSKNKQKENVDCPIKKQVNPNKRLCKGELKKTATCGQGISESKPEKKCNKFDSSLDNSKNVKKIELEKTKKDTKKTENDKLLKNDINIKSNSLETKVKDDCSLVLNDRVSSIKEKSVEEKAVNLSDDELMNYAAIGSHREENSESPRSGDKRKHSNSEDNEPNGKKCKTEKQQALLKKIDVDMFLNKVHGNLGKP